MPRRVELPSEFSRDPFSVSAARAAGVGEGRLRNAELTRPFRGVRAFLDRSTATDPVSITLVKCRAFTPVMLPGHFFSHLTAARLWGCPLSTRVSEEALHVASVAPAVPPRRDGIVGHEITSGSLRIMPRLGLPVADPASTWLQSATLVPLDDLVVAGDHLILDPAVLDPYDIRPHVALSELAERLDRYRGRGRRRAREALDLVRQGAESRMETLLRLLLQRAGLPEPAVNLELTGIRRRWRHRADLVYLDRRVIVEYDGDHHRTDSRQYETDMRRFDDFVHDGWELVRVRKYGVIADPADTVERVRSAIAVGGRFPA